MERGVKKFLAHVASIEVIPPDNGEAYSPKDYIMHVGDGEVVRIVERQRNLAVIMATEKLTYIDCIVKAGYELVHNYNYENKTLLQVKNSFRQRFKAAYIVKVQKLQHFMENNAAKAIGIDPAWVLGQQVALFEICKRKGDHTNAVRLLNEISYHVDVDSRVSNKITVDTTVDYAALLQQANERTIMIEDDSIIELPSPALSSPLPILIEGA